MIREIYFKYMSGIICPVNLDSEEAGMMDDFGINEMLEMQKTLQEKYKDIWETISPEAGKISCFG